MIKGFDSSFVGKKRWEICLISLSFCYLVFLYILGKFYTQGIFQKVMILEHLGAFVFHQC